MVFDVSMIFMICGCVCRPAFVTPLLMFAVNVITVRACAITPGNQHQAFDRLASSHRATHGLVCA